MSKQRTREAIEAQLETIRYLLGISQVTEGAPPDETPERMVMPNRDRLWHALFCEIHESLMKELRGMGLSEDEKPIMARAAEIEKYPWATPNVPRDFTFRDKTQAHLDQLCFGVYVKCSSGDAKIAYGGEARARQAIEELAKLGITAAYKVTGETPLHSVSFRLELKR